MLYRTDLQIRHLLQVHVPLRNFRFRCQLHLMILSALQSSRETCRRVPAPALQHTLRPRTVSPPSLRWSHCPDFHFLHLKVCHRNRCHTTSQPEPGTVKKLLRLKKQVGWPESTLSCRSRKFSFSLSVSPHSGLFLKETGCGITCRSPQNPGYNSN